MKDAPPPGFYATLEEDARLGAAIALLRDAPAGERPLAEREVRAAVLAAACRSGWHRLAWLLSWMRGAPAPKPLVPSARLS
jgi:hypothetical protein